ncbi:MAG: response regulator transcription factor [Rhodocyclales bacterium]|nr:response regulator transcription factor [Rhodocyclales bacterium]
MSQDEKPLPIRVLLVDDHQLVRDGLRSRLGESEGIAVVGEAGTGSEALLLAARLQPDLVLLDIGLPDISGLDVAARLGDVAPNSRALMLSMYDNREYVVSALRAGACGYVLKDATSKEIVAAIRAVAAGGSYCSAPLTAALANGGTGAPPLTDREREVLILVAQGNSNKRIAQQLDVSVRTVETHRLNLRRKLGIETPAGLIKYALQQGWIKV